MFRSALAWTLLPWVLVILVLLLDRVQDARRWPVFTTGLLDEPAHLFTAVLVLLAVAGTPWLFAHRAFTVSALAASMAIDLDHLPLYAGLRHITVAGGRPFTHSAATVLVLLVLVALFRRARPVLVGLAMGVCLHFVRDVATGPGLPLYWPVSAHLVLLPYELYVAVLVLTAICATLRAVLAIRRTSAAAAPASSDGTAPGRR